MTAVDERKDPAEVFDVGSRAEGVLPQIQWTMAYECEQVILQAAPNAIKYLERTFGSGNFTDISDALGITHLK